MKKLKEFTSLSMPCKTSNMMMMFKNKKEKQR